MEVIEDVKEFFLGFFLVDDELEIVDDEDVKRTKFIVEVFAFAFHDGIDKISIKIGDWRVEDFEVWMLF